MSFLKIKNNNSCLLEIFKGNYIKNSSYSLGFELQSFREKFQQIAFL
jgi:hypothetical protein